MSQRNPLNERYTTDEGRGGKTRKSAASAKPATKAAASVHVPGRVEQPKGLFAKATAQANKTKTVKDTKKKAASKEAVERRKEQAMRAQYYHADTPEYKRWKKVWWAMLGGAIVSTFLSFYFSSQANLQELSWVFVALSYIMLFVAIILDFFYLRKLRNEYQNTMIAQEKSKKNSAKRKEAAAEARRAAKEAAENPEPEEDRKLFRGLFTKKRASDAVATAKSAQERAENLAEAAAKDKAAAKGEAASEDAAQAAVAEAAGAK